jgi:hypothetical protein
MPGGGQIQKVPRHKEEIPSVTQVFREFAGINVASPRQSIRDDQFAWLENYIPIAPGNLRVMNAAQYVGVQYNVSVLSQATTNIGGTDYIFAFLSDGSATYISDVNYTSVQFASAGTFTNPSAIPYASPAGAPGLLIIDPVKGYFDFSVTTPLTLTVISASVKGTTIASYAGRVWIGNLRTIQFTDVASYTSFAGAGGSLTITDSYLHYAITSLYAANGFLYIFGDDSIDTLSNVQVVSSVTTFSRVNITSSIGTSFPQSVFPYYRSIMFANSYGIYSLSGATPQKVSDDLDGFFNATNFVGGLVAGSVSIFGEFCMCWTLRIVDNWTTLYGSNITRTLLVCFLKGKWFLHYPGFDITAIASIPVAGSVQIMHCFSTGSTPKLYEFFAASNTTLLGFLQTKLWDGGEPMLDKEVLMAGVGPLISASVNRTVTVTTDNEYGSQFVPAVNNVVTTSINFINNSGQQIQFQNISLQNINFTTTPSAYSLLKGTASTANGKYYGMSVKTYQTNITLALLALEARMTRPW